MYMAQINQISNSCIENSSAAGSNTSLAGHPFAVVPPSTYDGADGLWYDATSSSASRLQDNYAPLLHAGQPCTNLGDNSAIPVDIVDLDGDSDISETVDNDLNGDPRIQQSVVDAGAFEVTP